MSRKPLKKSDQDKPWVPKKAPRSSLTDTRPENKLFLIVSEGEKTEPFYFEALAKAVRLNQVEVVTCGLGDNTQSLVNRVAKAKKQKEKKRDCKFDETWVLFDQDSFEKDRFDNAIFSAQKKGYQVGWSNECFELWYLLHFRDQQTAIDRDAIFSAILPHLKKIVAQQNIPPAEAQAIRDVLKERGYRNLKGDAGKICHQAMATHPNRETAIQRAENLFADHTAAGMPPSQSNPCTTVFKLVKSLTSPVKTIS